MFEIADYDFSDFSFEWDPQKEALNFNKHGVRFKTAAKVFFDPDLLIRQDSIHAKETRYNVLGKVGKVLFVVCVIYGEKTIRIISARSATRSERARYYHGED